MRIFTVMISGHTSWDVTGLGVYDSRVDRFARPGTTDVLPTTLASLLSRPSRHS